MGRGLKSFMTEESRVGLFPRLLGKLDGLSTAQTSVLAVCLVITLGVIDYATGYEISFSVFYTIPVAIVSWRMSAREGYFWGLVSSIVWEQVNQFAGEHFFNQMIPIWNAFTRFLFFCLVANLLANLNELLKSQKKLARTDSLTGLLSRRAFIEIAEIELARARRFGRPMSIAFLDIDDFKKINDLFGHTGGDLALKSIASALKTNLRTYDAIARIGGDEFAIVFPDTNEEKASACLQRALFALAALPSIGKEKLKLGFSAGIVTIDKTDTSLAKLMEQVDALMYKVKKSGKAGVASKI